MFKRSAKNLVMAVVMAGLVFGISACSKKDQNQETGMTQNDQVEQPKADTSAADAAAAAKAAFTAEDIHFDFDSSAITPEAAEILKKKAQFLADNATANVNVEGHCDERGTEEYNRSLGERRALAVREEVALGGIDPKRVYTISFGEDRPAVDGHNEQAWAKNRRGEFILLTPR